MMKPVLFVLYAIFLAHFPAVMAADRISVSLEGEVISVDPIVRQERVSRRDCWEEPVEMSQPQSSERSYGGAVIGGLVGGLLGNQVGGGSGKNWATAAAAATGAIVGDNIDNDGHRGGMQTRQRVVVRCPEPEMRVVGYKVKVQFPGNQAISYQTSADERPEVGDIVPFTLSGTPTPTPTPRVRRTYQPSW